MSIAGRRATNLTINAELLDEAKALNLNLSQAAEIGIAAAIRREKDRQWQQENAEAIRSSNEYVEKHGLPLEKYRLF